MWPPLWNKSYIKTHESFDFFNFQTSPFFIQLYNKTSLNISGGYNFWEIDVYMNNRIFRINLTENICKPVDK